MLRDEILHMDTLVNNTINFFYVFVAGILTFSFSQDDSIFLLTTYVVMIPAYIMVLSKTIGIYRVASYLYVFHEGGVFNWERRNKKIMDSSMFRIFKEISSINLPFFFVSLFVLIIFCVKTNWDNIGEKYELLKIFLSFSLYMVQLILIIKNRKITLDKYIPIWKNIYSSEN